jgi:hypothetical protein
MMRRYTERIRFTLPPREGVSMSELLRRVPSEDIPGLEESR